MNMTPRQQIITALIAVVIQRKGTVDTIEEYQHVVKLADMILAEPDPTAKTSQDLTQGDYKQAILVLEQDLDESLQRANLGKDIDMWKERAQSVQDAIQLLKDAQMFEDNGWSSKLA